jgi:hypothetical protein
MQVLRLSYGACRFLGMYYGKVTFGCWRTRFLCYPQNDKGGAWSPQFNGIPTHLILRYAQNDKGGAGRLNSALSLLAFFRFFTALRMTEWGQAVGISGAE